MDWKTIMTIAMVIISIVGCYFTLVAINKAFLRKLHRKAVANSKDDFGRIDYEKLTTEREKMFEHWVKIYAMTSRNKELDLFILRRELAKMIEIDSTCPIEEYATRYDIKPKINMEG